MKPRQTPLIRKSLALGSGILLVLALSACSSSGCGSDCSQAPTASLPNGAGASAVQQDLLDATPVSSEIVAADNAFGLSLFQTLTQGSTSNIVISPTSIAIALQMLYNGAAGDTQQGMSQALQLQGLSALQVDQDNAALQAALINPDPKIQLTIANSLWMHLTDNPVLPTFTATNQTYYAAEIGDLAGAPGNVNAWVSNETDGLITAILPSGNYNQVVAVIANAIYFKGAWTNPFDPSQTMAQPFTLADGTPVSCEMMHQNGTYPYYQGVDFQAIELPYGTNRRMSMVIILPSSPSSLNTIISSMSVAQLNGWIAQMHAMSLLVALPRFTASYGDSLPKALTTLGMGAAFNAGADFSGMAPGASISDVEHKTVVQVDETGTVAAGSTAVINATVVPPSMTMDQPFVYAIRDNETGALLFVGALFDPTQTMP